MTQIAEYGSWRGTKRITAKPVAEAAGCIRSFNGYYVDFKRSKERSKIRRIKESDVVGERGNLKGESKLLSMQNAKCDAE